MGMNRLLCALTVLSVLVGCGGSEGNGPLRAIPNSSDSGNGESCTPGTERCACHPEGTCRAGLTCASGLCVVPPGSNGKDMDSSSQVGAGGARMLDGAEDSGRIIDAGGIAKPDAGSPDSSVDMEGGRSGGSGSPGEEDSRPRRAPIALFVMQDRSSSMVQGGMGASPQSWDNSQMAMTAFISDPMSAGIDIGLGTFPVGPQNTSDCATGADCGTPVVPIAPLTGNVTTGNAPAILNAYASQRPAGLAMTPTECALRGMINTCLKYTAQSSIGEKCVAVLVTDGTPTQCNLDEAALTAIIEEGKMKGVKTFTLGLPGADINVLNEYALAGGTDSAFDVSAGPQAFVAALNAIRDH